MTRHAHRLVPWQRHTLYLSAGLLTATGVVWLGVHYGAGAGSANELPHPLEAWAMRLHGLVAYAGLFVLGVLAAGHMPQGWRLAGRHRWARQRRSGVALCVLAALLTLTGYLLNYFAPEGVRPLLGWIHALIGLATGAQLVRHRRHPRAEPASERERA